MPQAPFGIVRTLLRRIQCVQSKVRRTGAADRPDRNQSLPSYATSAARPQRQPDALTFEVVTTPKVSQQRAFELLQQIQLQAETGTLVLRQVLVN